MISSSEAPHAETQDCTAEMKAEEGQKQDVSLLEEHEGTVVSQVLRQRGRTEGQGAGA